MDGFAWNERDDRTDGLGLWAGLKATRLLQTCQGFKRVLPGMQCDAPPKQCETIRCDQRLTVAIRVLGCYSSISCAVRFPRLAERNEPSIICPSLKRALPSTRGSALIAGSFNSGENVYVLNYTHEPRLTGVKSDDCNSWTNAINSIHI